MNEQTIELEKKIIAVEKKVKEIFNDDVIAKFEPKLKSDLKEVNYNCARPLIEQLENCNRLMQAPVYVGMLGRYSHGKSALVNSLFLMDDETKLPEGESVVTSKVTRVSFDKITSATAYKYYNGSNEREQFAEYAEFQNTAQSKDEDNSGIAFLEAKIPIGEKRNLARDFFQNNIQLIDMPGLGGPYYDDTVMTREYVSKMDLVVVAIKITEIEEAAVAVDKFLQKVNCPKIAVLTFYDLASQDNKYIDCNGDMSKIITKAKNEVGKHFSNIGDTDDIIVVSNKDNALVDKVRERILQKITVQRIAINTSRQEIPVVQQRKSAALKKEFESLTQKAHALPNRLEVIIAESIGKDEDAKIDICSIFDTQKVKNKQQKRKTDIEKEIKSFKKDQVSTINQILSVSECDSVCEKIKKDGIVLLEKTTERFEDYKSELKDEADNYIDNLNIAEKQKRDYKLNVKEVLINFSNLFEDVSFDEQSVKNAARIEKAKGFGAKILGFFGIKTSGEKKSAAKAKDSMKNALNKALIKFEKDIFKVIDDTDINIQKSFRNDIDMSSINKDIKDLIANKDKITEQVDELLEVIESVKYKI